MLENDHLDKGTKMGQGSSEQKQKSHSDLKENDIHRKSAVTLAFSSFYNFFPLYCLLFSSFAQDWIFFTLCHLTPANTEDLGKRIREGEIPILTFISSVTLTKVT